jgi:succinate-semialdehyde dehydrogenase/glutarate-semialdehyde dehydrogenase
MHIWSTQELGGNAPFIVLEDADIDVAVKAAMSSKFRCAGQTCVCADRFLVHSSIEEQFVSKLVDAIELSITVGDGSSAATTMGPLITSNAVVSVDEKVKEAVRNGAECVIGGSPMENLGSNFFQPTVVVNVKPGRDALWDKETFGPVAAIATFDSDEEAVSIANNSPSGLASYVCSRDVARALRIASR